MMKLNMLRTEFFTEAVFILSSAEIYTYNYYFESWKCFDLSLHRATLVECCQSLHGNENTV